MSDIISAAKITARGAMISALIGAIVAVPSIFLAYKKGETSATQITQAMIDEFNTTKSLLEKERALHAESERNGRDKDAIIIQLKQQVAELELRIKKQNISVTNTVESVHAEGNTVGAKREEPPALPPSAPSLSKFLIEKYTPYEVGYGCAIIPSERNSHLLMVGRKYTNGIMLTAIQKDGVVLTNLGRECRTLRYTVGHIDKTRMHRKLLQIYLDGKLHSETMLSPDTSPVEKSIVVTGVEIVKFVLKNPERGWTSDAAYGLMNMIVE